MIVPFPLSHSALPRPLEITVKDVDLLPHNIIVGDLITVVPAFAYQGQGLWLIDDGREWLMTFEPDRQEQQRIIGRAVSLLRHL